MREDNPPLLRVSDLKTYYPVKKGLFSKTVDYIKAVDGVSFDVFSGETLGLVGESGSGKSSIGRTIVKLEQATEGHIYFEGKDITRYKKSQMKPLRRDMGMIFQDPYSSLNPKLMVGELLEEPLLVNGLETTRTVGAKVKDLLDKVGLPQQAMKKFPHEFSGGQRQRIGIARVLTLQPKLIVCDEPVSALDVSIQAQILNLLQDLQKEYKMSYLFIGHGLGAVSYISERIAVMYMGKIVEIGKREEVFRNPKHPYTRFLLEAYPIQHPKYRNQPRKILQGEIPGALENSGGCHFHTRCPFATERCLNVQPQLVGNDGHLSACILNEDDRMDVENS